MKNFWISFWAAPEFGPFEIHSPWWLSGYRFKPGMTMQQLNAMDDDDELPTESSICVACRAYDEEAAKEFIYKSFDNRPAEIEFRFVEERPADWSPFGDRFGKRDWMEW